MSKKYYTIEQSANAPDTADVYIFGDITPFDWRDGDVSANSFVRAISELDAQKINVHIDSYGGSISEAWAIYNALRSHPAQVETWGDGFVASAALFPFLAGDVRHASSLSAYFLHEVWTYADGYAEDLRKTAQELETMTEIGINAFVERAGMKRETVRQLMADETWLDASRALELGIATDIVRDSSPRHLQSAKRAFMQKYLSRVKEPAKEPEHKEPENKVLPIMAMLGGEKRKENK